MPHENDYEETYLREQLVRLQREYQAAAQPYVDRLVYLESMKAPSFTLLSVEDFAHTLRQDPGAAYVLSAKPE